MEYHDKSRIRKDARKLYRALRSGEDDFYALVEALGKHAIESYDALAVKRLWDSSISVTMRRIL